MLESSLINSDHSEALFHDLGLTEEISKEFIKIALSDIRLFDRKQRDYGSRNISDFGEHGVLVRANDKIARLKNLQGKPASNEAVEDSWADLSVYGVIARMCRAGTWPGLTEEAVNDNRSEPEGGPPYVDSRYCDTCGVAPCQFERG